LRCINVVGSGSDMVCKDITQNDPGVMFF
jgi:hypothetical protein